MDIFLLLDKKIISTLEKDFKWECSVSGKDGLDGIEFVKIVGAHFTKSINIEFTVSILKVYELVDLDNLGIIRWGDFLEFCMEAGAISTRRRLTPFKYHFHEQKQKHENQVSVTDMLFVKNDSNSNSKMNKNSNKNKDSNKKSSSNNGMNLLMTVEREMMGVKIYNENCSYMCRLSPDEILTKLENRERIREQNSSISQSNSSGTGSGSGGTGGGKGKEILRPATYEIPDALVKSRKSRRRTILAMCMCIPKRQVLMMTMDGHMTYWEIDQLHGYMKFSYKVYMDVTHSGIMYVKRMDQLVTWNNNIGDYSLYFWKYGTADLLYKIDEHTDSINKVIEIESLSYLVTAGADRRIILWDCSLTQGIQSQPEKDTVIGERYHKHAIKHLAYSEQNELMISAGFETEAFVWDMHSTLLQMKLIGHRGIITGVSLLEQDVERALTCDNLGQFRLWSIERTIGNRGICVYTFSMQSGAARTVLIPKSFCAGWRNQIIVLSKKIHVLDVVRDSKVDSMPYIASYSPYTGEIFVVRGSTAMFISAVDGSVIKQFYNISSDEITSICIEKSHKKLVIGNAAGEISMHSTLGISRICINKTHHSMRGDVTKSFYVNEDDLILSCGADASIKIFDGLIGKCTKSNKEDSTKNLLLLREMKQAHQNEINVMAYSRAHNLIATASPDLSVILWDFERLHMDTILLGTTAEVTSMCFIDHYPLLFVADSIGRLLIYMLRPVSKSSRCISAFWNKDKQIENQDSYVSFTSMASRKDTCEIFAGCDNGSIQLLDFSSLIKRLRIRKYNYYDANKDTYNPRHMYSRNNALEGLTGAKSAKMKKNMEIRHSEEERRYISELLMKSEEYKDLHIKNHFKAHTDTVLNIQIIENSKAILTMSLDLSVMLFGFNGMQQALVLDGSDLPLQNRSFWRFNPARQDEVDAFMKKSFGIMIQVKSNVGKVKKIFHHQLLNKWKFGAGQKKMVKGVRLEKLRSSKALQSEDDADNKINTLQMKDLMKEESEELKVKSKQFAGAIRRIGNHEKEIRSLDQPDKEKIDGVIMAIGEKTFKEKPTMKYTRHDSQEIINALQAVSPKSKKNLLKQKSLKMVNLDDNNKSPSPPGKASEEDSKEEKNETDLKQMLEEPTFSTQKKDKQQLSRYERNKLEQKCRIWMQDHYMNYRDLIVGKDYRGTRQQSVMTMVMDEIEELQITKNNYEFYPEHRALADLTNGHDDNKNEMKDEVLIMNAVDGSGILHKGENDEINEVIMDSNTTIDEFGDASTIFGDMRTNIDENNTIDGACSSVLVNNNTSGEQSKSLSLAPPQIEQGNYDINPPMMDKKDEQLSSSVKNINLNTVTSEKTQMKDFVAVDMTIDSSMSKTSPQLIINNNQDNLLPDLTPQENLASNQPSKPFASPPQIVIPINEYEAKAVEEIVPTPSIGEKGSSSDRAKENTKPSTPLMKNNSIIKSVGTPTNKKAPSPSPSPSQKKKLMKTKSIVFDTTAISHPESPTTFTATAVPETKNNTNNSITSTPKALKSLKRTASAVSLAGESVRSFNRSLSRLPSNCSAKSERLDLTKEEYRELTGEAKLAYNKRVRANKIWKLNDMLHETSGFMTKKFPQIDEIMAKNAEANNISNQEMDQKVETLLDQKKLSEWTERYRSACNDNDDILVWNKKDQGYQNPNVQAKEGPTAAFNSFEQRIIEYAKNNENLKKKFAEKFAQDIKKEKFNAHKLNVKHISKFGSYSFKEVMDFIHFFDYFDNSSGRYLRVESIVKSDIFRRQPEKFIGLLRALNLSNIDSQEVLNTIVRMDELILLIFKHGTMEDRKRISNFIEIYRLFNKIKEDWGSQFTAVSVVSDALENFKKDPTKSIINKAKKRILTKIKPINKFLEMEITENIEEMRKANCGTITIDEATEIIFQIFHYRCTREMLEKKGFIVDSEKELNAKEIFELIKIISRMPEISRYYY